MTKIQTKQDLISVNLNLSGVCGKGDTVSNYININYIKPMAFLYCNF